MTPNQTLSIPNALKAERPEDYYKNTATIEWPDGADGQPLAIETGFFSAAAFKAGGHVPLAKEFVRFLVEEGWLAHYLDFSGERYAAADAEAARCAVLARPERPAPHGRGDAVPDPPARLQVMRWPPATGDTCSSDRESVWAKAVHRVAAEGISPEQAVDEAIARIKQILSE